MNAKKKQYGRGLGGFIFGLLLATAVIAGILYFLNGTKSEYVEVPKSQELPKPEILTPASSGSAVASAASDETASAALENPELEVSNEDEVMNASEPSSVQPIASVEKNASEQVVPVKPVVKDTERQQRLAEEKRRAEQQAREQQAREQQAKLTQQKQEAAQQARAAEAKKKAEAPKATKPTPEQILNSGSLEKAQKEAASKSATSKTQSDDKAAAGRVILQMGSYNNEQAAEAQRAKLAMMGITANVVQASANGKTVYRVQSGRLDSNAADSARKILQQNGVSSFTRSAN